MSKAERWLAARKIDQRIGEQLRAEARQRIAPTPTRYDVDTLDAALEGTRSDQPAHKYLFLRGISHRDAVQIIQARRKTQS